MAIRYRKNQQSLEESGDPAVGSINSHNGFIHTFGYKDIDKIKDVVREIIESGYENLGGTRASLDSVFTDKESKYRIFSLSSDENDQGKFCAVAIYKVHDEHPRLRYIAGRGGLRSKGVYALIEYEIKVDKYCCFAEVSGAIEHMYAKSNGYVVPNTFVKKILGSKGITPIEGDFFRYEHSFTDGSKLVKTLYGFKNQDLFNKITNNIMYYVENFGEYESYEQFRDAANKYIALSKKKDESLRLLLEQDEYCVKEILDWAIEFFVGLEEQHFGCHINEFPEKVFEEAEFMFYVIEELGSLSQYKEAESTYKRWRSEVTPLVLLTPEL